MKAEKSSKFFYSMLSEQLFMPPTNAMHKWNEDLGISIQDDYWEFCFSQIYKCTISAKLRAFQYRFLHRIIFTNYKLYLYGIKDSAMCSLCNEDEETQIHYFYECVIIQRFWQQVLKWIKEQSLCDISFSGSEILLGMETEGLQFWAFIFMVAKYYLYLGHEKEWPTMEGFLKKVQEIKFIE